MRMKKIWRRVFVWVWLLVVMPMLFLQIIETGDAADMGDWDGFAAVEKEPLLLKGESGIYEEPDSGSQIIGQGSTDTLCYALKKADSWWYIESGEVCGFVPDNCLLSGDQVQKRIEELAQAGGQLKINVRLDQINEPVEDRINSDYGIALPLAAAVKGTADTGDSLEEVREALVLWAQESGKKRYEGIEKGKETAASVFIREVYDHFHFTISGDLNGQWKQGIERPVSEVRAGDIIFYQRDGKWIHGAIYIGSDKVVQMFAGQSEAVVTDIKQPAVGSDQILAADLLSEYEEPSAERVELGSNVGRPFGQMKKRSVR